MIKALWFLVRLALLIAVIVWVAERPGDVTISWLGYRIETSVGFALLFISVLIVLSALIYRFWRAFVSVPKIIRRYQSSQNREKGYNAVTKGLVAVASGDNYEASRQARRAEGLLPDQALTKLLGAQSALMNDDAVTARLKFQSLLEDKDAAFFGVRGLLNEARRKGDRHEAVRLMRHAESLQPRRSWIIKMLFDYEAEAGEWEKAEQTLSKAIKTGAIDRETGKKHRIAIYLARSDDAKIKGITHTAISFAKKAYKQNPGFPPAPIRLARLFIASNKQRAAARVIENAWAAMPHPDLINLWDDLAPDPKKGEDKAMTRFNWVKRLTARNPQHRESRMALGKAAMEARLWGEARAHLKAARAYRLLARLEQQESGNEAKAREWLEMAAETPAKPAWVCTSCGTVAPGGWAPLCSGCKGFDTLSWTAARADTHMPQTIQVTDYALIEPPESTSGISSSGK